MNSTFSGKATTFLVSLSAAVGLGNIWRFPYVVGENGGAAFLFLYFFCVFFVGLPIMISEFVIGRAGKSDAVTAYRKIGGDRWGIVGYLGLASSILIALFYTTVAGWVYYYFFKAATLSLPIQTATETQAFFRNLISGTALPLVLQGLVILTATGIVCLGVRKGIERFTKIAMPLLLILLLICLTQSLSLPGASQGIDFLLKADFSKLTGQSVLTALGLAFFKLSIGTGALITYSQYFKNDISLIQNAGQTVVGDTLISLLVGLIIFPIVFTFGLEPTSGPGLLFETIPLVFAKLPGGYFLTAIFFFLAASAATAITIALFEPTVSYLTGNWHLSRNRASAYVAIFVFLVGSLATLSTSSDSLLGNTFIFGRTFFDSYDYLSSNIFMPLGGLLCAYLAGWRISPKLLKQELTNQDSLKLGFLLPLYGGIIRYVTPLLVIIIFLNALGVI